MSGSTTPAARTATLTSGRSIGPFRRLSKRDAPERRAGYLLVLPIVVLFAVFVGWPILRTVYLSLTSWSGFGDSTFVGLDNFTRIMRDPVALGAFRNTVIFAIVTTVLQTALAMPIAVAVNSTWRTAGVVVRTLLFIPGIVSFVVSGVIWKLIYDPNFGTLNQFLTSVGLGDWTQLWLGNPSTVLPAIIVVSLWGSIGTNMLILFAGLQGIDPTQYEAAQVDGANVVQQFRHVTIPGLRIVTAIVVSLNLLNGFKIFDIVFVMTGGGPNNASQVLGTYLYSLAFGSTSGSLPQFGYASALSVLVMVLCTSAVGFQLFLNRRARR